MLCIYKKPVAPWLILAYACGSLVSSGLFGTGNHTSTSFPEVMPSGLWVKRTGLFLLLWFPESGIPPPTHPRHHPLYMRPR